MAKYLFKVNDMTCGGCASNVQTALENSDNVTHVDIDVEKRQVSVESDMPESDVIALISQAGYTPEVVEKKGFFGRLIK